MTLRPAADLALGCLERGLLGGRLLMSRDSNRRMRVDDKSPHPTTSSERDLTAVQLTLSLTSALKRSGMT